MLLFAKSEIGSDIFLSWKFERKISLDAFNTIVIVVSPLNSLMINQISRVSLSGIRAFMLSVKECSELSDGSEENMSILDIDFKLCEEDKLGNGSYHIVFCHPESFISTKYGREILMSKVYQDNVVTIVIDEAHCILDW